jgi:hypothetical protein
MEVTVTNSHQRHGDGVTMVMVIGAFLFPAKKPVPIKPLTPKQPYNKVPVW